MATIQSSDLDFNSIKTNLKTYLQRSSEFQDYDFEASGLSNILDVLAYNTHINGLIANLGINESFLSSAQLRASVVSHAETLGYRPRSKTASKSEVNLSLVTGDASVASALIPQYTTFTASVDGVSYTFQTLEQYTAANDGAGTFTFLTSSGSANIELAEGIVKTKTFIVGDVADEQVFVIPDTELDTTTLNVNVFDTVSSSSSTQYTNIENAVRINENSTIFIVREAPNGFHEITFSEGNVLGVAPVAGNKIVIQYIASNGALANGATTFVADDDITVGSDDYTLTVTTVTNSAGGDDKESINSIKANAPISFATQQRLVTAEDYKALVLSRYSTTVQDVTAWGGNDNVPPIYGRVYLSLKFKSGVSSDVQTSVKNSIQTQLAENLGIMSIDTAFTDPTDTFLEITTRFNFDPDLSGITADTQAAAVQVAVNNYFTNNLNSFDSVFRRSLLLAVVDDISPAILDSSIAVRLNQRFTPTLNFTTDYTVDFPTTIAAADDVNHILNTSNFVLSSGETVTARNRLESNTIELVDPITGIVVVDNAGSINNATGVVSFVGINVASFSGSEIRVTVTPSNQSTIRPLRNYILNIDTGRSTSIPTLDFQNTPSSISTYSS